MARNRRTDLRTYGFPDSFRVKLAYAQQVVMTQSSVSGSQLFSGNSVFDPDATGTGSQPSDFDLYALVYNRYRVLASAIEIRAVGISSAAPTRVAVFPTNMSTTTITISDLMSSNRSKEMIVGIGAGGQYLLKHQCSTDAVAGGFDNLLDVRTAVVSGNPSDRWYWHISTQSYDASSSTTVYLDCRIVYDVEFFDRALEDVDLLSRLVKQRAARDEYLVAKARDSKVEKKEDLKQQLVAERVSAASSKDGASKAAFTLGDYELVEVYRKPSAAPGASAPREETKTATR